MENEGIYLKSFDYCTTITGHTNKEPKAKGSTLKSI